MFRLGAVVAKRSDDLEFQCPQVRNEQIRNATSLYAGISVRAFREVLRDELRELRLAVWANTGLKLLKRDTAAVYRPEGIRNIVDELLHSSAA